MPKKLSWWFFFGVLANNVCEIIIFCFLCNCAFVFGIFAAVVA